MKRVTKSHTTPKNPRRVPPLPPSAGTTPVTNLSFKLSEKIGPTPADKPHSPALKKTDKTPQLLIETPEKVKPQGISTSEATQSTQHKLSKPEALHDKPRRRISTTDTPRRRPPPPVPHPLLESNTPKVTPVPTPRAKARMKKVKLPTSQAIPPPPSIPLPPPPSPSLSSKLSTPAFSPPSASPIAIDTKPADASQPPPLSGGAPVLSDSNVGSVHLRVGNVGSTQRASPKGSRPPPPTRISSLIPSDIMPSVVDKRSIKAEKLEKMKEFEHVDGASVDASEVAADSKNPPTHPPPPRPENLPPHVTSPSRQYSKPPRDSPPPLPTARHIGTSVSPRGHRLMGSLKRMVKRDSKKSAKAPVADEGPVSKMQKAPQPHSSPQKKAGEAQPVSVSQKKVEPIVQPPSSGGDETVLKVHNRDTPSVSPDSDVLISPTNHVSTNAKKGITALEQRPPERPSHPPNTVRPTPRKRSTVTSPKLASEPVQLDTSNCSTSSSSSQPPPSPPRTSISSMDKDTSKNLDSNSPPPRPVRTSANALTGDPNDTPSAVKSVSDTSDTNQLLSEPEVQEQINTDSDLFPETPANFYKATKSYDAKSADELSFAEGDTLMFIGKRDNGFYYGMKDDGNTGLFLISSVEPFFKK